MNIHAFQVKRTGNPGGKIWAFWFLTWESIFIVSLWEDKKKKNNLILLKWHVGEGQTLQLETNHYLEFASREITGIIYMHMWIQREAVQHWLTVNMVYEPFGMK